MALFFTATKRALCIRPERSEAAPRSRTFAVAVTMFGIATAPRIRTTVTTMTTSTIEKPRSRILLTFIEIPSGREGLLAGSQGMQT